MAKQQRKAEPISKSLVADWGQLTWDDLDAWAGDRSVSRGRSYQQSGRGKQLCVFDAGGLLAWVHGNERYATHVQFDAAKRKRSGRIVSQCSCPVRHACKHAVAVIVECLQAIEDGTHLPVASGADSRLALIDGRIGRVDADKLENTSDQNMPMFQKRTEKINNDDIRRYLASKSFDDLLDHVMRVCRSDSTVRRVFADECALAGGRCNELLEEARSEMRSLTAEEAWQDSWTGEGHLPDYSGLKKRLKTLLDHGYAEAVVQLGEELIQRGIGQIEQSDDEGETVHAIGDCMQIVYEALLKSERSDEDKIVYAIDKLLVDEYGICDDFALVSDRHWKKTAWSGVADRLRKRLDDQQQVAPTDRNEWHKNYRREQLSGWVVVALDHAGRAGEATELCLAEVRKSGSYTRAVRRLIEVGDKDHAEALAIEGLHALSPRFAGVVSELQDLLCEIAAKKKDWMLPASTSAVRFFYRSSLDGYRELLLAAKKTKYAKTIQKEAAAFLESGQRPDMSPEASSTWPLPKVPQPCGQAVKDRSERCSPQFDILIELAIDENRPNDVLIWFDRRESATQLASHQRHGRAFRDDAMVAKAVENTHPERAIEIYERLANAIAAETNSKTYPQAGAYLKQIRLLLMKLGRQDDWLAVVSEFRTVNRRKRRLMEVVDSIEGLPIIKSTRK